LTRASKIVLYITAQGNVKMKRWCEKNDLIDTKDAYRTISDDPTKRQPINATFFDFYRYEWGCFLCISLMKQ
jgi:hypothetical protein